MSASVCTEGSKYRRLFFVHKANRMDPKQIEKYTAAHGTFDRW